MHKAFRDAFVLIPKNERTWPAPCGRPLIEGRVRRQRWPSCHHGHQPHAQPKSGGGEAPASTPAHHSQGRQEPERLRSQSHQAGWWAHWRCAGFCVGQT